MSTEVNADQTKALKEIKELVNLTYEAKKKVKEAEDDYKALAAKLSEIMENSEIDTFEADNCKAFCKPKSSVTFPKDVNQKRQVISYIKEKYGEEVAEDMITINPRSFNSWYNSEMEAALSEGNLDFDLAGIKPYEYFSLSFRKK